ncbi:hypothetical protein [Desulfonatronovibrio hydrogenovorans]|uniref:hypothetical protein n=1 Tax=Desulfonatronovibrio hydrogenovorans TaxID=53245 RepID=UPI0005586AF5|nr:hypothetical protein [Desulfonatronovibrio hydrogenovorans]
MIFFKNLVALLSTLFLVMVLGCSDPGPAEQAGEKVDEAVESVEEALDPAGPAERAGRTIDETIEDLGEALEAETDD